MKTITARLSLVHLRLLGLAAALVIAAPLQARAAQVIDGLKIQRAGHTATRLQDGNILIVGGENGSGPVCDAEIFDPASKTFSLGAGLMTARTEHTATRLSDGRVLVIGGRTSNRLLNATEIYDPETRSFSPGPVLDTARAGHTATLLPDGRIVVVGGDSGGSVEVFDPAAGAFQRLEARLAVARRYHAAALLKDGTLLIAGGNAADGAILSSAELLDTGTLSFSASSPSMRVPRSGLALRVLPDGKVQAIGGDAEGTMEMFNPVGRYFTAYAHLLGAPGSLSLSLRTQTRRAVIGRFIPAKLLQILGDDVVSLNNDFLDRTDYSLTEIAELGQALGAGGARISGGLHTSAALYTSSTATVTTDKTDYSPGETIIITGTGWQPGETVSLNIHRDTNDPPDTLLTAVADASGNIQNSDYIVQETDLGLSFLLTATGQSSGYTAQTTFTDSVTSVTITAPTGGSPVTVSAGASVSVSFNYVTSTTGATTADIDILPGPVASLSAQPITPGTGSATIGITIPGGTASGTYNVKVTVHNFTGGSANNKVDQQNGAVIVNGCSAPTITNCAPAQSASAGASCQAAVPDFTATTAVSSPGCTATVTQNPAAGTLVGLGPHTVTITATNASGTATCNTTFTVNDTTAPTITLTGADPLTVECHTSFTDPGATAHDACAGDFAATASGSVNANVPGTYTLTYNASDPTGNAATPVTRTVNVVDTTPPSITLGGSSPMTVECHGTFTDPGATAHDTCAGDFAATASGSVNANVPGTYTLTYNASDPTGNAATPVTRTVNVVDTTPPSITLGGSSPMTVECHGTFTDPGATAHDACAGDFAATASGSVNTNVPGTYTLTYNASDPTGNAATPVTRTVNVVDTTKPVITIIGANPATVVCHTSYADAGATASDSCAGSVSVTPSGTVDVNTVGTYTITYMASDPSGNTQTATRTVNVVNVAPVVDSASGPPGPMAVNSVASVTTYFTDPDLGQAHTCTFTWDDGATTSVNVSAGATSCTNTHQYTTAGVYTVSVDVSDYCADANGIFEFVVIYDPNAGFVTGGGWINQPSDGYPSLPGRANFGFVSKYKKGSNIPDGETEFQFKAADINFHSSAYDAGSLVISGGRKATYRGDGTVNGQSGYRFLLIAYDGNQPGGDGVDRFRIKITLTQGGSVIYDNRMGVSEDIDLADPTALGGGSIVIHK